MTRAHRRGPWVPEEDATLMQLVSSQGPNNWVRISQHMHFRSPKQCRERFHQNLKPTLNHEPITPEEGEMIEQMVAEMGKRWAEIARRLGNRSDNAVKNWWNGSMNRRRRNVIQSSGKTLSNRLEPLSASRPSSATTISEHSRRHSYSRSWSDSRTPTISRPLPEASHFPSSSYPREASSSYYPPSFTSHEGLSRLPTPPYASSAPSTSNRLPNLFSSSTRPSMLILPTPQRSLEAPMISPVNSEYSGPPSLDRAPSLVSDHNSTSSISPKSSNSPRPELPAPIDTRSFSLRRGSSHSIVTPTASYHSDEGYMSAYPHSSLLSEAKTYGARSEESLLAQHASRWQPGHQHSRSTTNPSLPPLLETPVAEPKSARDTRMTFSSLLN